MPPDVKVSGLPSDSALDGSHYVPINDPSGPTTKRTLLSTLAAWLFDQLNIPTGSGSPVTRLADSFFDHVASGLVWAGDAYASTRNASMSAGIIYINGRRISIGAVSARAFTASKDTYIDVLDNQDGTGTLVYTEVTLNAASPALAANSVRIGIIITGATNILSAASVNQGQKDRVLPIASSIPYCFTDSIGNIICPRDPSRRMLAYRQIVADATSTGSSDMTGLNLNFIPPTANDVVISGFIGSASSSAANSAIQMVLNDVTAGANVATSWGSTNASGDLASCTPSRVYTPPAAGARNIKAIIGRGNNAATVHSNSVATNPSYIMVLRG